MNKTLAGGAEELRHAPFSRALPRTQPRPVHSTRAGDPASSNLYLLLACYFAGQVCLRTFLSSTADLDEAEQLLLSQRLCWGYGSQPPLYTWLQFAFFSLFGPSIFGLAFLKNLLLFGTFWATYATARTLTPDRLQSAATVLSLFLLPQVAWESQRDLTHSVLASGIAAFSLLCLVRLHQTRQTRWYLLLGVSAGLGLLSKYNFAVWIAGLLMGALTIPGLRPAICDRRMALAALLGALVFLPHAIWILEQHDAAFHTAYKFHINSAIPWPRAAALGAFRTLLAIAAFSGPLLLIYWLAAIKTRTAAAEPGSDFDEPAQLAGRAILASLALVLLLVACSGAAGFRQRWLQPVLVSLPVALIARPDRPLHPAHLKRLIAAGRLAMILVAIAIPGRVILADRLNQRQRLNIPYRVLADQINRTIGSSGLVVADTPLLAGNLRLHLQDREVVTPDTFSLVQRPPHDCLLVWDATRNSAPPPSLLAWMTDAGTARASEPVYLTALYRFSSKRAVRLGVQRTSDAGRGWRDGPPNRQSRPD